MKIGSAFPSKNLKAADLEGNPAKVTIRTIRIEEVGMNKERKPVVYFKDKEKGLVLNVTNSRTISKIVGTDETDSWPGTVIVLYSTETDFKGETVDCIRVRAPKPAGSPLRKPAPPPIEVEESHENLSDDFVPSDDDVPF